jgi:hypothetical protein
MNDEQFRQRVMAELTHIRTAVYGLVGFAAAAAIWFHYFR